MFSIVLVILFAASFVVGVLAERAYIAQSQKEPESKLEYEWRQLQENNRAMLESQLMH